MVFSSIQLVTVKGACSRRPGASREIPVLCRRKCDGGFASCSFCAFKDDLHSFASRCPHPKVNPLTGLGLGAHRKTPPSSPYLVRTWTHAPSLSYLYCNCCDKSPGIIPWASASTPAEVTLSNDRLQRFSRVDGLL